MTARSTSASAHSDAWTGIRRRLALHRRTVSAALAFFSVLLGLTALTKTPEPQFAPDGSTFPASHAAPSDGQLAVPIQLAEPAVAGMLAPGDVVDVMVADQRSAATLVAADLTVTDVPDAEGSGPWTGNDGLVVVAATQDQALALAGAAARGPVTLAVHP